jgi:hypothetical protein
VQRAAALRTAAPRATTNRIKLAILAVFVIEILSSLALAFFDSLLIAVVVAVLGPVITIALFKRRPILVIAGFIGLVEFGLGSLLWLWGACRVARPESAWARAFYGPKKLAKARRRYSQKRRQGVGATPVRTPAPTRDHLPAPACSKSSFPESNDVPAPDSIGGHPSPPEPWSPGKSGQGFLLRSTTSDRASLVLFAVEGEPNLVRLILHAEKLHAIRNGEVGRSVGFLHVTEGGYFSLHPSDDRERVLAETIEDLDPRLRWKTHQRSSGGRGGNQPKP